MLTLLTLLASVLSLAHGENAPGPHGGSIKMPGAWHTEVVQVSSNEIKVYLLDIKFENPSVLNSSVAVTFNGHHTSKATCKTNKDFYLCSFDKSVNIKNKGTLEVKAVRENKKGSTVKYITPLTKH